MKVPRFLDFDLYVVFYGHAGIGFSRKVKVPRKMTIPIFTI